MPDRIGQEVVINAKPPRVYKALLDAKQFSALTGAPAEIEPSPGGAFSCFGGMIAGCNVELIANRRIVQAWRAGNWPEGVYSIVKFDLEPHGDATKLALEQVGYPKGADKHLGDGWHKMYWEPLKNFLA